MNALLDNPLYGLKLVASAYMTERRAVKLPRCSVRTPAVRKAYQRVRRKLRGVGWVTAPKPEAMRIGDTLYAHPAVIDKIKAALSGEPMFARVRAGG